MLPIQERLACRDATVFVASDSFDALAERVLAIVGTGRRMTLVQRYLDTEGRARSLDIHTSLRLDDVPDGGVERWSRTDSLAGRGLHVHLAPGIHGFGFAAYDRDGTESDVARRYHADRPRNVTVARVDAWTDSPSREDRIEIERWNDHGVCRVTTVAFEESTDDRSRAAAHDVLDLAEAGRMPETFWATDSRVLRACEILGITPAAAREGVR
ncbi:hypothetical protein [Nocardioides pakistanensis]